MLKLLIADDEMRVCKLIRYLVDWNSLGIEIIGEAYDGNSAFQIIMEKSPDIVIVDIRMPEQNGLNLIRNVKKEKPETYFIVVSGYSRFEYAQHAIKYGVEDYLLKPLKKKELTEAVEKIIEKYELTRKAEAEKEHLEQFMDYYASRIKEGLLTEYFKKNLEFPDMDPLASVNARYSCRFIPGDFMGIAVKVLVTDCEAESRVFSMALTKVEQILSQDFAGQFSECIISMDQGMIYAAVNAPEITDIQLNRLMNHVQIKVMSWREVFQGIRVYFGLGERMQSVVQLFQSLDQASEAAANYILPETETVLWYQDSYRVRCTPEMFCHLDIRKDMQRGIELLDYARIKSCIHACQEELLRINGLNAEMVKAAYWKIVEDFFYSLDIKRIGLQREDFKVRAEKLFMLAPSVKGLFEKLGEFMVCCLKQWVEDRKLEERKPILLAKEYMQENFWRSLTLEEVSAYVGFNASYFSNLFKRETSMNFLEYLTTLRIDHARERLMKTDDSVNEIAEAVGYSDVKYFSRIFKRSLGLSPNKFRKMYK
ncbi:MAG: response regulator [Lachnospiraceae bacterium]|nr:response regulator [Lachnospiraceae bacterium]MCI9600318.1 response regulator [Lachnospiraceae bacterium]